MSLKKFFILSCIIIICISGCSVQKTINDGYNKFIDICGTNQSCYKLAPNGKYMVFFDVPFEQMSKSITEGGAPGTTIIHEVNVGMADQNKIITKRFSEGIPVTYGLVFWAENSQSFFIYGDEALLLFDINFPKYELDFVSFPYERERLPMLGGNKIIHNFINPHCYIRDHGTCDDYKMIWLPDGRLINPREKGVAYDVYKPDGEIERITLNVPYSTQTAHNYIATLKDTSYFQKYENYAEYPDGNSEYRPSQKICLLGGKLETSTSLVEYACLDGQGRYGIVQVEDTQSGLLMMVQNVDQTLDLFYMPEEENGATILLQSFSEPTLIQEVGDEILILLDYQRYERLDISTNSLEPFKIVPEETPILLKEITTSYCIIYNSYFAMKAIGIYHIETGKAIFMEDVLVLNQHDVQSEKAGDYEFIFAGWYDEIDSFIFIIIDDNDEIAKVECINPAEYLTQLDD